MKYIQPVWKSEGGVFPSLLNQRNAVSIKNQQTENLYKELQQGGKKKSQSQINSLSHEPASPMNLVIGCMNTKQRSDACQVLRICFLYFGGYFIFPDSQVFGLLPPVLAAALQDCERRDALRSIRLHCVGSGAVKWGSADGFTCVLPVCPRSIDGPGRRPPHSRAAAAADRYGCEYYTWCTESWLWI